MHNYCRRRRCSHVVEESRSTVLTASQVNCDTSHGVHTAIISGRKYVNYSVLKFNE